mmetsp:Transcript_5107/g.11306  ORF Transcript_5107/g.11306 Transcript_5107/m.11306 type:complete len:190 (-) Transcript_5107:236-805(-)
MEASAKNESAAPSLFGTGSFGKVLKGSKDSAASGEDRGPAECSTSIAGSGGRGSLAGGDGTDTIAQVEARWAGSRTEKGTDAAVAIVCVECGREGHACCGLRYWTTLRAAWLRASEDEVVLVPPGFEEPGSLQQAREGLTGPIRDLSEGELEELEDCLDAVQRPFPRLRRSVPLAQAVQCAEALWDTDD